MCQYIFEKCKETHDRNESRVKVTWLSRRDLDTGMENMLCSGVSTVLGRGVVGSFTTASVTNTSAHPINASKNSRKVIYRRINIKTCLLSLYMYIYTTFTMPFIPNTFLKNQYTQNKKIPPIEKDVF